MFRRSNAIHCLNRLWRTQNVRIQLKTRIGVGEILTTLAILISFITLSVNWTAERTKSRKEQSDQIRVAASDALDKLDRWREISSSYQELDPTFVETTELLKRDKDVIAARDFLWKNLINTRAKNEGKILDEKAEQASAKLYSYNPEIYKVFNCTVRRMKESREAAFAKLLDKTQGAVLQSNSKDWSQTAIVGDQLRGALSKYRESLRREIDPILEQTRSILFDVISRSDDEIANRNSLTTYASICK